MIDIAKQMIFWRDGAQEDVAVAQELLGPNGARDGMAGMMGVGNRGDIRER
jgi:hypothetical protein